MKADAAKRLRELKAENARLMRLLPEAELDKYPAEGVSRGNMVTPDRCRRAVVVLQDTVRGF
ncbi:hypothetical protein BH24ACT7_BH24ACT7_13720 [soil metagenome]